MFYIGSDDGKESDLAGGRKKEGTETRRQSHAGYEFPSNAQGADPTTEATIWRKAEKMEKELRELRAAGAEFERRRAERGAEEVEERNKNVDDRRSPPPREGSDPPRYGPYRDREEFERAQREHEEGARYHAEYARWERELEERKQWKRDLEERQRLKRERENRWDLEREELERMEREHAQRVRVREYRTRGGRPVTRLDLEPSEEVDSEPSDEPDRDDDERDGRQRANRSAESREERLFTLVEKLCEQKSEDRKQGAEQSSRAGAQRVNKNPPKFPSLAQGSTVHTLNEWLTALRTYVRGTWPKNGPPMLKKILDKCFEEHGRWVDEEPDERERCVPTLGDVELTDDEVDAHGLMCSDIASRLPTQTQQWAESRATERGDAPTLTDYLFRTLCVSLPSSCKAGDKVREVMEGVVKDSEKPERAGLATWLRAWKAQLTRLELMGVYTEDDNYSKLLTHISSVVGSGQTEEYRYGLHRWRGDNRTPVKRVTQEYCERFYQKVLALADTCYGDLEPKKKEAHLTEKEKREKKKKKDKADREANATEKGESQKLAAKVERLTKELATAKEANATESKGGAKGGKPDARGGKGEPGKPRLKLPCRHGLLKDCPRGKECRFEHDPKLVAECKAMPCRTWGKTGKCGWGKMCVFMHANALMIDSYGTEIGARTEVHLAHKLDNSIWGIYDVAAQETVVGEPHLVENEHGNATVKTVAGTTKGKHVDATTPFGTATNATYVHGARNLLAHQTVTRLGMVGFSWFNGRTPENVRADGPALYGKGGEMIPLQEQDGFALVPKNPECTESEVHHASGVPDEVGQRLPCWRCGGADHWAASCATPSEGNVRHTERQGEVGIWHWTCMPERSRRILWKALCKAGYATEGHPESYWASSNTASTPPPVTARLAVDLDVDCNWNVLLITKVVGTDEPARVERRIIRVYWDSATQDQGEVPRGTQDDTAEVKTGGHRVQFAEPEVQAYHVALQWAHDEVQRSEVYETRAQKRAREQAETERKNEENFDTLFKDHIEKDGGGAQAPDSGGAEGDAPTPAGIRNARRRTRKAEAAKVIDAIAKDLTVKDRNAMAHRILNHRTVHIDGCVTCALAKQRRSGHARVGVSKSRGTRYWHSDIAGPFPVSQCGAQYVLAVITEGEGEECPFPGYYPLPSRHSAVVAKCLEGHARVVGARPKTLRTDGAGDYRGKVTEWIEDQCSPPGEPPAKHDPTYRYSPWENGVSESAVEVSGDGVRTALLDGNAPTAVWPYALRWVRDTEALATGAFERIHGESAATEARMNAAPFASLVTVVREEPEKKDLKSFDSRAFRAFLIGYEPDGGVCVAFQNGVSAGGEPRYRELRTRNFKIFRNEPYFPEGTAGGPLFEAKRNPREHETSDPDDGDIHIVTWVACGREGCGKWREVLPNEAKAIAELDNVSCEMMGMDCGDPQDGRAFAEPTVEVENHYVVKGIVENGDDHWVEVHLFEPVKRKQAFSDEEYCDGKAYKELFGEALKKELGMYIQHGALRLDKVVESGDKSIPGDALRARLNLIYGFKDSEDPDRRNHRAKARMVACRQWDRWGNVSDGIGEEELLWSATPSFDSIRLVVTVTTGHGKEKKIVDWPAAYLQRKLRGPPVYGILPREAWPPEWEGKYVNPLVPIEGAVYGLKRAGHDFNAQADEEYHKLGWDSCRKYDADPCVYVRDSARANAPDAIARWTDDNFVCVEKGDSTRTLDELGEIFPHDVKARFDLPQKYVGIITNVEAVNENLEKITYNQVRYTRGIVDDFILEYKQKYPGKVLRQKDAPLPAGVAREESLDGEGPGVFAETCRKYMGALNFVQRCTRPDVAFAVSLLCGALDKWGTGADALLVHLFGYLDKYWNLVLVCWVDKRDFLDGGKQLRLVLKTDASFAPGGANKGTSGWIVFLVGPRTCAIIGWGANRQKVESLHTAESEFHAIVTGTRALTRIGNLADALMGYAREANADGEVENGPELQQKLQVDASATERALKLGFSEKFSHSRRTHRISLAWAHRYWESPREVELVSGKDFVPDALTKSLPTEPHQKYVGDMCLRPGPGLSAD